MNLTRSLLAGAAIAAIMTTGVQAADLLVGGLDPVYSSPLFNFEGFYVGGTVGAGALPVVGTVGTVGVVAGANFEVTEAFLLGVEAQADAVWNGGGITGMNGLLLGKVGFYLTDDMIAYGSAGGGWVNSVGSYAFGAGLEMAVAEQLSARAEVMGTGTWGGMPNGAKAAIGLLWHLN
jgi:opacity protein-like surface antigen